MLATGAPGERRALGQNQRVKLSSGWYGLVIVGHLLSVVLGFGSVSVSGAYAAAGWRQQRRGRVGRAIISYFGHGPVPAELAILVVPAVGVVLVITSGGRWGFSQAWLMVSIVLWAATAVLVFAVVRPAEGALQRLGAGVEAGVDPGAPASLDLGAPASAAPASAGGAAPGAARATAGFLPVLRRIALSTLAVDVLAAVTSVLMVVKPGLS